MIIQKYGVQLRRMTIQDQELLRTWRNAAHVSRFMAFREHITTQMQIDWFQSVNNFNNYYYIIEYQGKAIGLINDKNIDYVNHTSEGGLFLHDTSFYNTLVPVWASLALLENSFITFRGEKSFAHILKDNTKAQSFNKMLGYELCPDQENQENQLYLLTRERFIRNSRKLVKAATTLAEEKSFRMSFNAADRLSGLIEFLEGQMTHQYVERVEEKDGIKTYHFQTNILLSL